MQWRCSRRKYVNIVYCGLRWAEEVLNLRCEYQACLAKRKINACSQRVTSDHTRVYVRVVLA